MNSGFLNPKGLLLAGILILGTGWGINHFLGLKGVLRLETGKVNRLVTGAPTSPDPETASTDLGYKVILDSVSVRPHTPEFELKLWKKDSMPANPHAPAANTSKTLIKAYPLEQMKIQTVEETDLRFRLKEFYPDFTFAYDYPEVRDTLEAKAPGITLQLKTIEGTPIVTLLKEKPGPSRLDDIVSLGAALDFYWTFPEDSLRALAGAGTLTGNKIVFHGAAKKIFFILDGILTEQPLKEKSFYAMPGQDSVGFTILFCFPDAAYLKAVPSTKGSEILNPVAHVEIWREGGPAQDAFVYPESRIRKGGDFTIPQSGYKIGMDVIHAKSIPYCDCSLSIQTDSTAAPETISITSGKGKRYNGYLFTPLECNATAGGMVTMQVSRSPGRILIISGSVLAVFAVFLYFFASKRGDA